MLVLSNSYFQTEKNNDQFLKRLWKKLATVSKIKSKNFKWSLTLLGAKDDFDIDQRSESPNTRKRHIKVDSATVLIIHVFGQAQLDIVIRFQAKLCYVLSSCLKNTTLTSKVAKNSRLTSLAKIKSTSLKHCISSKIFALL